MKTSIEKIALNYKNGIICPADEGSENHEEALMFQAEVMRLGYILDQDLFLGISSLEKASINKIYQTVIPILWELKGADKKWTVFYPNFPEQVLKAQEVELLGNAICHYWSSGEWMPAYKVSRRVPKMEKVKFTQLAPLTEKGCLSTITDLLGCNISLSKSELADLEWLVEIYGEDLSAYLPEKITFKETLCVFLGVCLKLGKSFGSEAAKTATDVLRLMTHLSGGDISLAENTKFRSWKRGERRLLLTMLEKVINKDDVARHDGKWKKAFHGLHIGDYARKFPVTYAIATELRNGKIKTFNGKVEAAIGCHDYALAAELLVKRPGEFARRLDNLICKSELGSHTVMTSFASVIGQVDTRVLLQLLGHFKQRSLPMMNRLVMPKGMQSKARVLTKVVPALPESVVSQLVNMISSELRVRFAAKAPLGKVWIDPYLEKCPVPMAQRSASESLRSVARGTRLPLGDKKTLRMFVWWVGNDVDLSCVLYDEKFGQRGQLSYTNLRVNSINSCHSGDITHAPHGAAEFIDIDIDQAKAAGVRYIIMNVFDYTGLKFSGYDECFAGWMTRDFPNANEVYDAKTVEQKVDLRTDTRMAAPVLFDLDNREAIWLDLNGQVKGMLPNNVESNSASIVDMAQSALMLSNKLNLYEFFELHADARGQQIESREEAQG